ncbi:MAG: hypothetical protein M1827_000658 [Pycnora praestabilis]|nr:MAG: hypothetical protein M1827_000658 [Pycnora praestabilis]
MDVDSVGGPVEPLGAQRKRPRDISEPPEPICLNGYSDPKNESNLIEKEAPKRQKNVSEDSEALKLIPEDQAWFFDTDGLMSAELRDRFGGRWPKFGQFGEPCMDFRRDHHLEELLVICVIGSMIEHYDRLCSHTYALRKISPSIEFVAITHIHPPINRAELIPVVHIPIIHTIGAPDPPYLGLLGLLHPLGGGQQGLDAYVVVDRQGYRRLVLPIGWGVGKHFNDENGGKIVREEILTALSEGVRELEEERLQRMDQG